MPAYQHIEWDEEILLDKHDFGHEGSAEGERSFTCEEQVQRLNKYWEKTGVTDHEGKNWPGFWAVTRWTFLVNGLLPSELGPGNEPKYKQRELLERGPHCFRIFDVKIKFQAEVTVTRLEWTPDTPCKAEWKERVKVIEAHERKHVKHVEQSLVSANEKWKTRTFEACGTSDRDARDKLSLMLASAYLADWNLLKSQNEEARKRLDVESLGAFECSCQWGCNVWLVWFAELLTWLRSAFAGR